MNKTAEELLKIADEIEHDAAEVTQFVCNKCNHTASLASINARRKEAASEVGENVTVSDISVNDKISCPACDGVMAYSETEASKSYYYDPEKVAADADAPHDEKTETPAEEKAESPETQKKEKEEGTEQHEQPKKEAAAIDYDSLERYGVK